MTDITLTDMDVPPTETQASLKRVAAIGDLAIERARWISLEGVMELCADRLDVALRDFEGSVRTEIDRDKRVLVDVESLISVVIHVALEIAAACPDGETVSLSCQAGRAGTTLIRIGDSARIIAGPGARPRRAAAVQTDLCREILASVGGGLSRIRRPDGGDVYWISLPDGQIERSFLRYCAARDGERRRRDEGAPAFGDRRRIA